MMEVKPLPQYDDRPADAGRDFAGAGAFSIYALERMLRDCQEQPLWRMRAALCAAYYDGKQLDDAKRWALRQEDLEERAINLIRPVVNSVLGQEAKSRTDVKIEADDDADAEVAEVVSARLKEAERETCAHMVVSEAYASMVKKGLGWAHIGRSSDPLDYTYRAESVSLDEIWWDWRGQTGTRMDRCRWLVRQRMVDLDELEATMPEHRAILKRSAAGWADEMDGQAIRLGEPADMRAMEAFDNETRFNLVVPKWQWLDTARKMIRLYEVWYRVPAEAVVLHIGPNKRVVYDQHNPRHQQLVVSGQVKISRGVTSAVRSALYAGPYRLFDEATPYRNFPYFPFFAFRDDADRSPYGLVDGMIAPQDDYNDRRHRIQWMLKARQVQMDSDALDPAYNNIAEIAENIMRPDLVAITNPNRRNGGEAIRVRNDLTVQREQFDLMSDAKQLIQDTAGRYSSQLGNKPAGVTSGIANSLLIEQGEQAMGEMNDNYVFARRAMFEALVGEILTDLKNERMEVPVGSGKTRRVVVLNEFDPQTGQMLNSVEEADIKTALAETPNTPAYRQQTQQQVATIIQALGNNPQALAVLAPSYIESTSLPNRQQVADDLRRASGLPMPGDKEGQEQAEAMQQQQLAQKQQNEQELAQATVDDKVASAERFRAQARHSNAQAELIEARLQAGGVEAEVGATLAKTQQAHAANEDQMINDVLDGAAA